MKKTIIIAAFCLIYTSGLTACKTTVQDGPRKVVVEDNDSSSDRNFCPPGHAKKGWC